MSRRSLPIHATLCLATTALVSCASMSPGSSARTTSTTPPDMVSIPAGPFLMGSAPNPTLAWYEQGVDELPQHSVNVPRFDIDRYEVTVRRYAAFVDATGHRAPRVWAEGRPQRDDHPVVDVSWYDADAYCRWAGKRLPTEAEWEKAARGPDGRIWPWGDEYRAGAAALVDSGTNDTAPVGAHPDDVSPYGVYDMGGNVMEWTASWYEKYPGSTLARLDFGEKYRVLKGGAWTTPPLPFSRAANRLAIAPFWDHPHFGFRCAR